MNKTGPWSATIEALTRPALEEAVTAVAGILEEALDHASPHEAARPSQAGHVAVRAAHAVPMLIALGTIAIAAGLVRR